MAAGSAGPPASAKMQIRDANASRLWSRVRPADIITHELMVVAEDTNLAPPTARTELRLLVFPRRQLGGFISASDTRGDERQSNAPRSFGGSLALRRPGSLVYVFRRRVQIDYSANSPLRNGDLRIFESLNFDDAQAEIRGESRSE